MARVRMSRLCRRGIPSRALPAAPRRRETASRGAHRLRKARDPRSRASVVFQPRTSADARFPRSTPPRAQARRASVRPPTGQRRRIHRGASSENARSPRAPTRAPSRETSSENERKPSSRRFRARRRVRIPRERSDRSNAHPRRYTTAFPQGEHQEEHSALLDRFRVCVAAVRMQPRRGARGGGKAANPDAWLGARGAAPWAASAPGRAAPSPRSSASGRRSRRTCRRGGGPAALDGSEAADLGRNAPPARKGLRRAVSLPSPTPSARRSLRASRRVLSRYGKARSTRR